MFLDIITNTFSDTKYRKWYISIISKALLRIDYTSNNHKKQALTHLEIFERHHICPKSIFPEYSKEKTNLAYLSLREHFIVHMLLYKMAMIDEIHQRSMGIALYRMGHISKTNRRVINSLEYQDRKSVV